MQAEEGDDAMCDVGDGGGLSMGQETTKGTVEKGQKEDVDAAEDTAPVAEPFNGDVALFRLLLRAPEEFLGVRSVHHRDEAETTVE